MNIVFIGMKHCGKTTHGKAFAAEMNYKFYDTDDVLMDMYNRRNTCTLSVREIFDRIGDEGFRELEEEVMRLLLKLGQCNVVSMGGRMPVNETIQADMKQLGFTVFLKLPPEVLFKRVKRRGLPSFVDPLRPLESFIELYQRREGYYLDCADLVIEMDDLPLSEARNLIFSRIKEKINAR
jgi:shikimate kinase